MKFQTLIAVVICVMITSCSFTQNGAMVEKVRTPDQLNDLELAHVAYTTNDTANNTDIQYAHLASGISQDPEVREFAQTVIRDHEAVNEQALALLAKLEAQPQDNFISQELTKNSVKIVNELVGLRGSGFDKRYAENELAYQKAVNDLMANSFMPNIENPEVESLFEAGFEIFKVHKGHAQMMVNKLTHNQ